MSKKNGQKKKEKDSAMAKIVRMKVFQIMVVTKKNEGVTIRMILIKRIVINAPHADL